VSADERLDVERLDVQLQTSPSAVQYALTRLVTEYLVMREDRGHVVKPLDVATSNEAHDARMAIELGVAEMTVGHLGLGQLSGLRRLAQATVDVLGRGDPDGIAAYALANQEFHCFLVATAGVDALSAVYEQLSIADLISRALRTQEEIESLLARKHLDLVQAYERADLDGVREVIIRHTAHAKQTQQRGIEKSRWSVAGPALTGQISPRKGAPHGRLPVVLAKRRGGSTELFGRRLPGVLAPTRLLDGHVPAARGQQGCPAPAHRRRGLHHRARPGPARSRRRDHRRRAGDVISVDRGRDHHFLNITKDLAVLVIFAPPDNPEA
jgi:DNA-binding GntR family transcriptional regulator